MPNKRAWLALRSHILALGTYTLLTFVMTWPIGLRLFTHLAGSGDDMWLFQWNNWWLRKALLERLNPYYTTAHIPSTDYTRRLGLFSADGEEVQGQSAAPCPG